MISKGTAARTHSQSRVTAQSVYTHSDRPRESDCRAAQTSQDFAMFPREVTPIEFALVKGTPSRS